MPRCGGCGAETKGDERFCKLCGFDLASGKQEDLDDETLILRLLDAPGAPTGACIGRIWLLDPSGGQVEQALELKDEITLIGRNPDCAVLLPSNSVSRHHARIRREGDNFLLRDLGSTNGTLLNSEPVIGEESLKDRDEIGIGIYRLIFRCT